MRQIILIVIVLTSINLSAKEGFWSVIPLSELNGSEKRPTELSKWYNQDGFIHKKAICSVGEGGSGSFISSSGLILTNYHIIRKFIPFFNKSDTIISLGFVAHGINSELKLPGLYIKILQRSIDVSVIVDKGILEQKKWETITKEINEQFPVLEKNNTQEIKREFHGRKHYLHEYKVIRDIRLVMCPPLALAIYGGDEYNWMWPRYSADFAILRAYDDNGIYNPCDALYLSEKGLEEDSHIIVCGYPKGASYDMTFEECEKLYIPKKQIEIETQEIYVNTLFSILFSNPNNNIQINNIISSINNERIKSLGILTGLKSHNIPAKLKEKEDGCLKLLSHIDYENYNKFKENRHRLDSLNTIMYEFNIVQTQYYNAIKPIIMFGIANYIKNKDKMSSKNSIKSIRKALKIFNKDVDRIISKSMISYLASNKSPLIPSIFQNNKAEQNRIIDSIYDSTVIFDIGRIGNDDFNIDSLKNDPGYKLFHYTDSIYANYYTTYKRISNEIEAMKHQILTTLYDFGYIKWSGTNGTLRVSYGDTDMNRCATELNSIISGKWMDIGILLPSDNHCYNYITDAHTSSGSSGSPVLNESSVIIGLNFDRDFNGVCSDYYYLSNTSRNICVNSKYILDILKGHEKYNHLLNEINYK